MRTREEIQNVYAFDVKSEEIHISQAESGRKGYFCLGCLKEMQAVISKKPNRISYFRHDHNSIKGLPKCTYSDETYRHKLAKEILLRIKRIKVPALYKYPPKGINGIANLISEARFIEADYVEQELYFYENEIGEIIWSKSIFSDENKYLLFKPDIIFFDKNRNPILIIEIVVTHKVNEKKLLNLKRLGINAIQVTIPKDSPVNIERTFETTNRTKWIYNYEQDLIEYIHVSNSDSEGIPSIDEDQRILFEESYKCRTTQINNLIRTIKRCLESEQFRAVKQNLESEISRIETNTKEHRGALERQRDSNKQKHERLRNDIRNRINSKYRERRERLDKEKGNFENEEKEFRSHCVEENKKFESNFNNYRAGIEQAISEKYRSRKESIEKQNSDLEERYNRKRIEVESNTESAENSVREFTEQFSIIERNSDREREIIIGIRKETSNIERTRIEIEKSASYELEYGIKLEGKYERLRIELEERIAKEGKDIEQRIGDIYRELSIAIETRNFEGNEHTRKFKNLLADLENVPNFISAQKSYGRYKKAYECITKSAYINWKD